MESPTGEENSPFIKEGKAWVALDDALNPKSHREKQLCLQKGLPTGPIQLGAARTRLEKRLTGTTLEFPRHVLLVIPGEKTHA